MAHYEPTTTVEDIHALNDFAVKLFRQVSKNTSSNVILSPTSVFLNLYEVLLGSSGKVREEIETLLNIDPSRMPHLLDDLQHLAKEGHVSKNIRDRHYDLFGGTKFLMDRNAAVRLDNSLARQLQNITKDEPLEQVDLENAPTAIDQLCASMTEQRIGGPEASERYVDEEEKKNLRALSQKVAKDSHSMILFSAVHFYAEWENKFLARHSTNYENNSGQKVAGLAGSMDIFHNADGIKMFPIMLQLQNKVFFAHDDDLKVTIVELPLSHYDLNLTIVLPDDENNGVQTFIDKFDSTTLEILRKKWQMPNTMVYFPKFHLESRLFLSKALQSLGLKHLFADNAELPGFGGVHVAEAVHVAGIEISAEAAKPLPPREHRAGECSIMEPDTYPRSLHVDRPFMFFITARHPEIWVLMGKVMDLDMEMKNQVFRHYKRKQEEAPFLSHIN